MTRFDAELLFDDYRVLVYGTIAGSVKPTPHP
jgi:hypothetical protein